MSNNFFQMFYMRNLSIWTPGPRMRNEQWSVVVTISNTIMGITDDLINAILQFKPFTSIRLRNLHRKEVYITPFPSGCHLRSFIIYQGHTDFLQHLRRFKGQRGATTKNGPPPPKAILIIFTVNRLQLVSRTLWNNDANMDNNKRAISKKAGDLPT